MIGPGREVTDVYWRWAVVGAGGAVPVRPDRYEAWRAQSVPADFAAMLIDGPGRIIDVGWVDRCNSTTLPEPSGSLFGAGLAATNLTAGLSRLRSTRPMVIATHAELARRLTMAKPGQCSRGRRRLA